jgi:hypothetical protein
MFHEYNLHAKFSNEIGFYYLMYFVSCFFLLNLCHYIAQFGINSSIL